MERRGRVLVVASLIGVGACAWWYFTPPTLASEGGRLVSCIEREDAHCVYSFVDEQERRAYDLDEQKVAILLSRFVRSAFKDRGSSRDTDYPSPTQGRHPVCRTFRRSNGLSQELNAETALTPKGIKGVDVIAGIALDSINAQFRKPGADRICALIEGLKARRGDLTQAGIEGFYQVRQTPAFLTVAEYYEYQVKRAASAGVICESDRSSGSISSTQGR